MFTGEFNYYILFEKIKAEEQVPNSIFEDSMALIPISVKDHIRGKPYKDISQKRNLSQEYT
jgi:hypothetical protein